jgi:hypothetical protein
MGLSGGAVGWTIWQLRTDAIDATISDSGNIATILAGQLSRSIGAIDSILLEVKRSQKGLDIDDPFKFRAAYDRKEIHDTFRQYAAKLPQIFNIVVADKDGQLVVSTAAWPTPDINIADRDYFQSARARPDDQLTTSIPFKNRIDGEQTIVFARRLETSSGQFSGIVFASVNSGSFAAIYESTQSIDTLIFNLIRQDGTILFRHPDTRGLSGRSSLLKRPGRTPCRKAPRASVFSLNRTATFDMYRSAPFRNIHFS